MEEKLSRAIGGSEANGGISACFGEKTKRNASGRANLKLRRYEESLAQ